MSLADHLGPHDHMAALIDAFLAAEKSLLGSAEWAIGNRGSERRISWPIVVNGQTCGVSLDLTAYPNDRNQFTIALCVPPCIWRLDFDPPSRGPHHNPLDRIALLGAAAIYGPHYHGWPDNRHRATKATLPPEINCARELPQNIRTFQNALRWFCGETKIKLDSRQMIDLPTRDVII